MNTTTVVIALVILANCIYFAVKVRREKGIEPSVNREELSRASRAALLGATAGFFISALGTFAYLIANDSFVVLGNQYAGPPGIMTCAVVGLFGVIPGSIIGTAFRKKRSRVERPHNQAL